LGCTIQFCPERTNRKTEKGTSEPNAHPFAQRRLSSRGYSFGIGLTHVSGFGIGAEITLLSVRFLERGGSKCRDRGAFG